MSDLVDMECPHCGMLNRDVDGLDDYECCIACNRLLFPETLAERGNRWDRGRSSDKLSQEEIDELHEREHKFEKEVKQGKWGNMQPKGGWSFEKIQQPQITRPEVDDADHDENEDDWEDDEGEEEDEEESEWDDEDELIGTSVPASFSSVLLGRGVNQKTRRKENVTVGDVERRSGLYILGKPGMGKTTLMVNLILQDIEHGHGLCFLDPHGDAIDEILKRLPESRKDDVILLDPLDEAHPFGLNMFQCDDPTNAKEVSRTLNTVLEVFAKLFTASGDLEDAPTMHDTLLNTIMLLVYNSGYTLAEVPLLLLNKDASAKLMQNIGLTHDDVLQWWLAYNAEKLVDRTKLTGSTRRRVQTFLTDELVRNIVGQPSTIDMQTIMNEGKILLVKLPRTLPQVTTLIGSLLIDRLLYAAYARETIPQDERRHFCLYCDEFQNYATPDFAKLITEGRKYRIATTIAHQERLSQLEKEDKNRGATLAAANLILFQTTVKDAEELAPEFTSEPKPEWVEVLEEEWTEKVEDEVVDGEEQVKAISQNPIDFLLHATHMNERVRKLRTTILSPLKHALETVDKDGFWFFEGRKYPEDYMGATRAQLQQGFFLINELLVDLMEQHVHFGSTVMLDKIITILLSLRGFLGIQSGVTSMTSGGFMEWNYSLEETRRHLFAFVRPYYAALNENILKINSDEKRVRAVVDDISRGIRNKQQKQTDDFISYLETRYRVSISLFANGKIKRYVSQAVSQLDVIVYQLLDLCLALRDDPILVASGQTVPRKRTQIHYITHPRQTITHPRRAEQDMVNEMARELAALPRFTAFAKIIQEIGKQQQVSKYKFNPDDLPAADDETVVSMRIAEIRQNTLQQGCCREREAVKQEMQARRSKLLEVPKRRAQTTSDEDEE